MNFIGLTFVRCKSRRGVEGKVLDCDIDLWEFGLQSRYCIPMQTNALEKSLDFFMTTSNRLNSTTSVLLQGYLWH